MPTERNNKATSTSPNLNDNKSTLNIRQRVFPSISTSSTSTSSTYPLGISFLSTSTPINESEDMAYIEKRTAHNALERQRREGLNTKFQELAHVLPALQQIRRPSKSVIVAKSLEFVSNAVERETDFHGQLHALRVENAQLLRQARLSNKRMRKQLENDNIVASSSSANKNGKLPALRSPDSKSSPINTATAATSKYAKSVSIIKSRKLPSEMKPQSRQSSLPVADQPSGSPSNLNSSTLKANKRSPSLGIDTFISSNDHGSYSETKYQRKGSRESSADSATSNTNVTTKESVSAPPSATTAIYEAAPQQAYLNTISNNKRRKRNSTTEIDSNKTVLIDYQSFLLNQQLHQQQIAQKQNQEHHRRNRINSHQPSSSSTLAMLDDLGNDIYTPTAASRHNSITATTDQQLPLTFNNNQRSNNNDLEPIVVVPSQFDISTTSTSPFGDEHTFYNTYENFEHVVSTIPAIRTPIGRNSSNSNSSNINQQQQQPYDPSLDIFNSLMQDQNPNIDNNPNYYW